MKETRLSEAKADVQSLEEMLADLEANTKQITKLKKYAMDAPESREEILSALDEYTEKFVGKKKASTARRAVSTIAAVSMLEILHE